MCLFVQHHCGGTTYFTNITGAEVLGLAWKESSDYTVERNYLFIRGQLSAINGLSCDDTCEPSEVHSKPNKTNFHSLEGNNFYLI